MPTKRRVLAAIDFGTFGSGYAWAVSSTNDDYIPSHGIYCNDLWPAAEFRYPKNRSAILVEGDGVLAWGFEAEKKYTESPAAWDARYAVEFKMHLSASGAGGYVRVGRNTTGLPAEELITRYLRMLYAKAREHISQAGYDDSSAVWCLSVPAIWSHHDKQVMRRAAVRAGFPEAADRLIIVLEPEVAALYCMASQAGPLDGAAGGGRHPAGSRILVVDCGGGTTDLAPMTVRADGRFDQEGEVTGNTSGSARVTRNFVLNVLLGRLGKDVLANLTKQDPTAVAELRRRWEQALNVFDPTLPNPVRIELSARAARTLGESVLKRLAAVQGGEDDAIIISPPEMCALLDTSVDPICALVNEQLGRLVPNGARKDGPPVAVYLVGGFANSRYLRQRLKAVVKGRATLYVPPRPENAVLFGGVQYANNPDWIRTRTMRLTYGYGLADAFDPNRDDPERRYRNNEGAELCRGRFRTLVRRGDLVPAGTEVVSRIYPLIGDQRQITLKFYASEEADPRYVDDGHAVRIGRVEIVLPEVKKKFLAKEREIDLLTTFGDTTIKVRAIDRATGFLTESQIEFDA